MAINYYIIDLETNGLKEGFHEICELSIIRASDKVQLTRTVKVECPENSSIDALKITGKTIQDLQFGISKAELIEQVENFVNEDGLTSAHRCLIGHNIINFDKKFLWELWDANDKIFPFDLYLDTIHLSRDYAKKNQIIKPKVNLQDACSLLGVKKVAGMHSAAPDTRNCYLLWQKLIMAVDHLPHIKRFPHAIEEEDNTNLDQE